MNTFTLLFIDDELPLLNSIRRILKRQPFNQLYTSSGEEALKILETVRIDAVICDMRMPEMNGITLLKHVKEFYPNTKRIACSAYNQPAQLLASINQCGVHKYLVKPISYEDDFLNAICECLNLDPKELPKST